MDRLLFTVNLENLAWGVEYAERLACGLELTSFFDPEVLTGDWLSVLAKHQQILTDFSGKLGLHGAFYDMVSGSYDPDIVTLTRQRYLQNLQIAADLNVSYVVFHLNYMGILKFPPSYRDKWHRRNVDFWGELVEEAKALGIVIALENMWEDDPKLISNLLREVAHPNLAICLDVAHVQLFSPLSINDWVTELAPWLYTSHLNNTDGKLDLHLPLHEGVISYEMVLPLLRALDLPPTFTLEMPERAWIEASMTYFDLGGVDGLPAEPQLSSLTPFPNLYD